MLQAIQIKPDVYWVGALDWNEREFHGYATDAGITYNAYLILDEKVTLIDTTKVTFKEELLERISSVIDPSKIDIIVSNHVEGDHSGNIPTIRSFAPNCKIYTSDPAGIKGLTAHYGDLGYIGVKTGDELNIGKRTLKFIQTPMVHWPDNMVTYDVEDKILFSNDAFGQHFASSKRFDDENDMSAVMHQARKYYANIVQPYRMQAANAMKAVRALGPDALDLIAPAHGVIWRSYINEILDAYDQVYTSGKVQEKALVIYDTMYDSTEALASAVTDGFMDRDVQVQLMSAKKTHESDIMEAFLDTRYVCIGTPTMNSQMLPTVAGLLNYMKGLSPKNENRIGLAFGSYGWAPLGPNNVQKELEAMKFQLPEKAFAVNWTPTPEQLSDLRAKVSAMVG